MDLRETLAWGVAEVRGWGGRRWRVGKSRLGPEQAPVCVSVGKHLPLLLTVSRDQLQTVSISPSNLPGPALEGPGCVQPQPSFPQARRIWPPEMYSPVWFMGQLGVPRDG